MKFKYRLALVPAVILIGSGCTTFGVPTDDGNAACGDGCADGLVCVEDSCVFPGDVIQDVSGDVTLTDDGTGPMDTNDIDDRGETDADARDSGTDMADDGGETEIIEIIQDLPPETGDISENTTGRICLSDDDCIDGECVVLVTSGELVKKICTGPCGINCPVGTACMNYAVGDEGFLSRCEPYENGLCYPCETGDDCLIPGSQCLRMQGGGTFCTMPCEGADSRCPFGFECTVLDDQEILPEYRAQCLPQAGGCDCVFDLAQAVQPCRIENEHGVCEGSMSCYPEVGWMKCSAAVPALEMCDGVDNDCDGRTDQGFTWTDWDGSIRELGETCGTGACANGTVQCLGTTGVTCSTAYLAQATDNCGAGSGNGIDDNCDGQTDEDCEISDADGDGISEQEGDCNDYDPAFYPEAYEPCCPPIVAESPAALAKCDRNCNGVVTACDANDLDFDGYSDPSPIPSMRDCDDTNPLVHPGAPEVCDDGIDNDCLGDGDLHCCYPDSDPGCVGPFDNDGDGYVGAMDCNDNNPDIHPGAFELCDMIDNDCDGITDNGNPGGLAVDPLDPEGGMIPVVGGAVCGTNEGECGAGIWVCVHYETFARLECIGGEVATEEICDDLDNDCDGLTDEDFPGKGDICDGDDLDLCENGVNQCNLAGTALECIEPFELSDLVEICDDGIDQDCDGITDNWCFPEDLDGDGYLPPDDCDNTRSEVRPIALEPCCDFDMSKEAALAMCDWDCNGITARCNPVDYDCDGAFDVTEGGTDCDEEDPQTRPGFPDKCGDGIDQDCSGMDTTCDSIIDRDGDGYGPGDDCDDNNRFVFPWAEETCNGVDDDCDGITDDGNPGTDPEVTCGSSLGICRIGREVCVHFPAGPQVVCVPEVLPAKEMCDGLDNNCNGRTDEVFRDLGLPCDGPDSDLCRNGRYVCNEQGDGTVCGPELVENLVEICDGIDNDCDGLTDEDFTHEGLQIGAPCVGWGLCGPGTVVCSVDGVRATCSTNWDGPDSQAQPEMCDGVDNDCDNVTDNGMTWYGLELGSLCQGIGECGIGHVECSPETLKAVCSVNPDGSNPRTKREWCNGLDDDCDGRIDNNLVATEWDCKRSGVCEGVMIPAECVDGQWSCDYSVVPDYTADEAFCDDLDNDCDGQTDEGFGKGEACDGPDYDKCKNGVFVCRPDGNGVECGPETIENITEKCDRQDNDCDGRTDEDFPVGELCDGPDDDLCKNGSFTCSADGLGVVCNNEWLTNIVETCDGQDNDCDGETDEGFDLGLPCDSDDPDLCEFGHTVCNEAGDGVVCYEDPEQQATDEKCDGIDNDCNGSTDEGFNWRGTPIGEECDGIGECGPGRVVCAPDGESGTCSTNADGTASQAVDELCDHLDNDCDGLTDEDLTWNGLALGEPCVSTGDCAGGTVVCSPTDLVATCSTMPNGTEPGASDEKCDGIDNDCDGFTDEDLETDISGCLTEGICLPSLVDARCEGSKGWVCDYSGVPGYQAETETSCDGIDNNCDGQTDETWSVGDPCDGPDEDLCKYGTFVCNQAGDGAVCSDETQSFQEQCGDAADNDCDGQTDEEDAVGCVDYWYSADGDAFGVGSPRCLCQAGQVAGFVGTAGGDCNDNVDTIYPGAPELCNFKDDDCDGFTDEDPQYNDLGGPCDGDDPDTCANGMWVCSADKLSLVCSGDYNSAEKCNGVDDDCNGETDELWPLGEPCDGGDGDYCQNSTWTCRPDGSGAQCIETIFNIQEKCNGKDDDCDGFTDETFPLLGQPCDGSDPDSCANGTWTCKANGTGVECVNESTTYPSGTEYCDGFDNNCNGSADETWPTRLQRCDGNDTDTCKTGTVVCNGSQTGVECIGDVVCAPGATCTTSGSEYVPDECLCGMPPVICSRKQGSTCTDGVCLCGIFPACTGTTQCLSDGLGGYSCQ